MQKDGDSYFLANTIELKEELNLKDAFLERSMERIGKILFDKSHVPRLVSCQQKSVSLLEAIVAEKGIEDLEVRSAACRNREG